MTTKGRPLSAATAATSASVPSPPATTQQVRTVIHRAAGDSRQVPAQGILDQENLSSERTSSFHDPEPARFPSPRTRIHDQIGPLRPGRRSRRALVHGRYRQAACSGPARITDDSRTVIMLAADGAVPHWAGPEIAPAATATMTLLQRLRHQPATQSGHSHLGRARATRHCRALHQPTQAVARPGHTNRQARPCLPGRATPRRHPHLDPTLTKETEPRRRGTAQPHGSHRGRSQDARAWERGCCPRDG